MRGLIVFLWEQWRQTYKGLLFVFVTLVFYGLLSWKFRDLVFYIFALNQTLIVSAAYLPVLGAVVLLFLQENRGRIGFAYSRRMLVLPVHTFVLVAAPLLYRLVLIVLFGIATGWVCDAFLRDVFFKGPEVLLLMTLVAALHAFVFLVTGYGASTGTAIFLLAFLIGLPGLNVFLQSVFENMAIPSPLTRDYMVPKIGLGGAPWACLVIPYWFLVAYQGARKARSNVAEDPVGRFVRVATRITYFDRERTEFASPEAAQQWLEWRRGAYLFPWLALILGLILVFTLHAAADQMENRFVISFYVLAVAPAAVAVLAGYTVTRGTSDYQWFVGARPLTTMAIARARLRAGIRAVFWAYVLVGTLFVITYKVSFPHDPILPSLVRDLRVITSTSGSYSEGLMLLAFLGVCTVTTVWSLFWLGRVAGVFVWLAASGLAIWYYIHGHLYVIDPDTGLFTSPTDVFMMVVSALMGVAGVCALIAAVWRGYINIAVLIIAAVVWGVLLMVSIRMGRVVSFGSPLVLAGWMLLPIVPLASIPLTLEWQRHR